MATLNSKPLVRFCPVIVLQQQPLVRIGFFHQDLWQDNKAGEQFVVSKRPASNKLEQISHYFNTH